MAAIAWSDVVDEVAALASASAGKQARILDYVNTTLNVSIVGGALGEDSPKLKTARVYMACHMGLLQPRAGFVTSEGEGDLSIAYSMMPLPPGSDPYWSQSSYGMAFQSLIRTTRAVLPMVV